MTALKPFKQYKRADILAVAEAFAVDIDPKNDNIQEIAAKLAQDGVTPESWQKMQGGNVVDEKPVVVEVVVEKTDVEKDEPTNVSPALAEEEVLAEETEKEEAAVEAVLEELEPEPEALALLKMVRRNYSYEIRGYRFTATHPFVLVSESDAEYLVEVDRGFRYATPKEAKDYYS